ncbi:branched-chain amino acid ABC transporter permease [Rhodovibrionaceae bacterium A322]
MLDMKRENLINLGLLALLLAAPLIASALGEVYYVNLASRVAIIAMAAVGLNLALGFGGLISFGHAAFFGLGGYVAGIAAFHAFEETAFLGIIPGSDQMLPIWLVAMGITAVAALFIGAISLRTSGVYFIMITLAFAQMIFYFAISWPTYGGEDGLSIYVRNSLPLLDTYDPLVFFGLVFAALCFCLFLSARFMGSRFGAALTMVRLNETRLATAGIEPFPIKLTAFVISAMMTGWAGALYADLNGFIGPSMLSWHRSGEIMVIVILGGVGRLFGPVAGAILFILLETFIGGATEHWQLFLGMILLAVVLFAKGGVLGLLAGKAHHD